MSRPPLMQLLVLSNGHGEDAIAVRILEQLQRHPQAPQLAALPLVGEGHAYQKLDVPIIGQVQSMPSGGFIYMDLRQLWQDVRGGLVRLTVAQYQTIRRWGQRGGKILAVGDILPLSFAWLSGSDYAFVGTAKSEYYLRDENGWLPRTSWLERRLGSAYLPWERWLMGCPRCQAVFPRDSLTARVLQQGSIPAFDLGNPMMDGIDGPQAARVPPQPGEVAVVLLPGSRSPEAERNWEAILSAIASILAAFPHRPWLFLGAIAPALALDPFQAALLSRGWQRQDRESSPLLLSDPQAVRFTYRQGTLLLARRAYGDCLHRADLALAMAGTATEQFVGLGKPAIAMVGGGPQFTYSFAEAQTRLLGPSAILVGHPAQVPGAIASLMADPDRWQQLAENGRRRMGPPGAAERIARCLMEVFSHSGQLAIPSP